MIARTHRPQLAQSAMEQSIVHRKGQARLTASARGHGGARTQRVVEVGRVHLRALVRRACTQASQRIARATPRLDQGAIPRTVLQADRIKAVVQRHHVCCT